jgi:hypothetical protein
MKREVLPLLGCERPGRLDHGDRTFFFIRKPSLNMCKSVVHSFERSPHPWLFTMIRFGCDMAGEIVHIVERQMNNESRSERLCGLETSFQLGIDKRALDDQIALTWVSLKSTRWSGLIRFRRMLVTCRTAAAILPPSNECDERAPSSSRA